MAFKVPKEIDLEDKIVWFLTMRQLVICMIGFGVGYFAHGNLDGYTWPIVVGIDGLLTFAFAFVRIQDMTFFQFLLSAIGYFSLPHERVWKQHADQFHLPKIVKKTATDPADDKRLRDRERLGGLRELALRLDHGASDPVAARAPTADEVRGVFDKIRRPDPAEVRARVEKLRARPAGASAPASAEPKSPDPAPKKSAEPVGDFEKKSTRARVEKALAPAAETSLEKKSVPEKSPEPAIQKPAQTPDALAALGIEPAAPVSAERPAAPDFEKKSPEPTVTKPAQNFQKSAPDPRPVQNQPAENSQTLSSRGSPPVAGDRGDLPGQIASPAARNDKNGTGEISQQTSPEPAKKPTPDPAPKSPALEIRPAEKPAAPAQKSSPSGGLRPGETVTF